MHGADARAPGLEESGQRGKGLANGRKPQLGRLDKEKSREKEVVGLLRDWVANCSWIVEDKDDWEL